MSGGLFHILGLPVTGYALALAASVLLVFLLARLGAPKAGITGAQVETFFIFALPLCLLPVSYTHLTLPTSDLV